MVERDARLGRNSYSLLRGVARITLRCIRATLVPRGRAKRGTSLPRHPGAERSEKPHKPVTLGPSEARNPGSILSFREAYASLST